MLRIVFLVLSIIFYLIVAINVGAILWSLLRKIIEVFKKLSKERNKVNESFKLMNEYIKKRYEISDGLLSLLKTELNSDNKIVQELDKSIKNAKVNKKIKKQVKKENALTNKLEELFSLSNSYALLNDDSNFSDIKNELLNNENEVEKLKRKYNEAVTDYNKKVKFNILAKVFGFNKRKYFKVIEIKQDN